MLPDGAEKQLEDWTIFFLNQTSFNTIAPVLALEDNESYNGETADRSEMLYVLNLVRTKHDKSVRRCVVKTSSQCCTSGRMLINFANSEVLLSRLWLYAPGIPSFKYSSPFSSWPWMTITATRPKTRSLDYLMPSTPWTSPAHPFSRDRRR